MAFRSIVLMSALVLALLGAGPATAGRSTKPPRTIDVTAKDYAFSLSTQSVHHGPVRFVIRNAGHTTHDFAIAGHTSKMVAPGKTTTLTVVLRKGRYPYRCTVDSHAKLGMKGTLRVT